MLFGLTLGCGGSNRLPEGATGKVSGKVTLEGEAVPEGTTIIFLHKKKGLPASGTITSDGLYSLNMRGGSDILVGSYSIGLSPPERKRTPEEEEILRNGGSFSLKKEPAIIPQKYRVPEKSGIIFEVKEGKNTYNLDIKSE